MHRKYKGQALNKIDTKHTLMSNMSYIRNRNQNSSRNKKLKITSSKKPKIRNTKIPKLSVKISNFRIKTLKIPQNWAKDYNPSNENAEHTRLVNNMIWVHLKCVVYATKQCTQFWRPHWNLKDKELINRLQSNENHSLWKELSFKL